MTRPIRLWLALRLPQKATPLRRLINVRIYASSLFWFVLFLFLEKNIALSGRQQYLAPRCLYLSGGALGAHPSDVDDGGKLSPPLRIIIDVAVLLERDAFFLENLRESL